MTELEWLNYFDDEGRIENSKEIRYKIFSGVTELQCLIFLANILMNYAIRVSSNLFAAKCGNSFWDTILGNRLKWRGKSCATVK